MLIVPDGLPAQRILSQEGVHVISPERAVHQDVRPLKIVICNLMPDKPTTETQLLRLLSRTPLQVEVYLLRTSTYKSKNTSEEYLASFYVDFQEIQEDYFDALIITGAPLGTKAFHQVKYWDELRRIMDWSRSHVFSTLHLCWSALAGLYHHYGVEKKLLEKKLSGVYLHQKTAAGHGNALTQDFDDSFWVPHSRFSGITRESLEKREGISVLVDSEQAGPYLLADKNFRQVFVLGHPEYDRTTLSNEYDRDISLGLRPALPVNYFPKNDMRQIPIANWQSHAQLLYSNWINCIYQHVPFVRQDIAFM